YVWREVQPNSDPCTDSSGKPDFFDFALTARGLASNATGSASSEALAVNSNAGPAPGEHLAFLDSIARDPSYDANHLVDITNWQKRVIDVPVQTGLNTTLRVRLTNANAFGSYLD